MANQPASTPPNQLNLFLQAWDLFRVWVNLSLPSQSKQLQNLRGRIPH